MGNGKNGENGAENIRGGKSEQIDEDEKRNWRLVGICVKKKVEDNLSGDMYHLTRAMTIKILQ